MSRPERRSAVVHINGRWLSHELSGTERFAGEIVSRVVAADGGRRFVLHLPAGAPAPSWAASVRIRRSRTRGQVFEQLVLPITTIGRPLISIAGPAPVLKRRQVVAMHDATPFALGTTYHWAFRLWYRTMYRILSRTAKRVVTVSHFSAGELAKHLHTSPERFSVIPNGADHLVRPSSEDFTSETAPYVLLVGGNIPHKNTRWAVEALAGLGLRIVVVGKLTPSRQFAASEQQSDAAEWVGRVSDDELRRYYARALCLVFPSLYEGFGVPVLEAQALGCPVVCSTDASIPEVAGEGALYFDTDSPDGLRSAVRRLRDDPTERQRLVELGSRNLERFGWDASASAFARVLDSL